MDQLNDKELFESAINDAPIAEAEPEGQPRDENGRFASKAEPEAEQPAVEQPVVEQQTKPEEAHVPSWRLREVNEAREAAERRAQEAYDRAVQFERQLFELQKRLQDQQQKPQEQANWFENPDAAIAQHLSPVEQRIAAAEQRAVLRASRAEQIAIHGRQAVDEMEKAIGDAMRSGHPDIPMLRLQMQNSDDPVGVGMQWFQREKLTRETGGNIEAYREKLAADLLKDPTFLAKAVEAVKAQAGQPTRPNTVVQLPPSINRATSAASPHDDVGDLSSESLYAFATR